MYHYTECGLNNIWLANGFKEHDTAHGRGVAIENAEGLHYAIAMWLINTKPQLSGGEFRFLRKEMNMSQAALAHLLGKDAQTIARWEKRGRAPKMAGHFLRGLYREDAEGNAKIREIIERLNKLDQTAAKRPVFEETDQGWMQIAA